jgi:hypothetical protein
MTTATKTPVTKTRLDKGRRAEVEAELADKYGVKFIYVPAVSTSAFDTDKSLHNQARFIPLDESVVNTYAEAMRRGDSFPAVLAWKPTANGLYRMIDGNHRLHASIRAEEPIDTYALDPATSPQVVMLMTYAYNAKHGLATSIPERIQQAVFLVDGGATIHSAAAAVNVDSKLISRAMQRSAADARADDVGFPRNQWDSGTFTTTSKTRLASIATDEGFREAIKLTYSARLGYEEVGQLVSQLKGSRSASRQVGIVKTFRDQYLDRIQDNAAGVMGASPKRKMAPKQRVRLAISQALSIPGENQTIAASFAPAERHDAVKKLHEAAGRLNDIATLLMDADGRS